MPPKKHYTTPEAVLHRVSTALQSGMDLEHRTLYLFGVVDDHIAYRFIVGLNVLDSTVGDIRVVLMSTGGDEDCGYAIFDALRATRNDVQIDGYGGVHSIAALILQAGQKRRLGRECRLMIHNGSVNMDSSTIDVDAIATLSREIDKNNARYHRILAQRSGNTISVVAKWCLEEKTFAADEAVKAGFADEVINGKE